ncbi:MAG TPA: hypothetical protein PLN52_26380 [Opitutaceae bacterium]|nr:hypothetical protein [Opitutaceae bacterium]
MSSPTLHPDLVAVAARLAHQAHAGQFRRDQKTPYVRHPEAVAQRVVGDCTAEAVAWLHDVLEDTTTSAENLRAAGIPDGVIACVQLLTKSDTMDYEAYLAAIRRDPIARKVKVADMLANLSDRPSEKQILKYARGLLLLLGETEADPTSPG